MSAIFRFTKATNRKTEAYWLNIFGVNVLISYETPVAFNNFGQRIRRNNDWGPTTGRHMRECGVDSGNWKVVHDEKAFNTMLDRAITERIMHDQQIVKNIVTSAVTRELTQEAL